MAYLFIKIQQRYGRALFVTLLIVAVLVQAAGIGTCQASLELQLGGTPLDFTIALYSLAMMYLFMPARAGFVPLADFLYQEFAWLEKDIPKKKEEAAKALEDMKSRSYHFDAVVDWLNPFSADGWLGMLRQELGVAPSTSLSATGAAEKMKEVPIFCMELAVKLFYWTRLAYVPLVSCDYCSQKCYCYEWLHLIACM